MTFAQPIWFVLLLLIPLLFLVKKRGYLGFSDNRLHSPNSSRALRIAAGTPSFFLACTLALLAVALARPQIPGDPVHRTIPGRDIMLAVDISFSMSFPFKGTIEQHDAPQALDFQTNFLERRRENKGLKFEQPDAKDGLQRIHAAQSALLRFVENRWKKQTGDRIGLIVFDSRPRFAWPITDDLRMLYRKMQFLQNSLGNATNFGRVYPGPIDLAVEHFKESGQAKSKVLILATDGEDDIDPLTEDRLIKLVLQNDLRLYLVGIGETLARKDVGIVKLTERLKGRIFRVEDAKSLLDCFETIDQLEKSEVTVSQMETRNDVFFYFAWAALASLGLFLVSAIFVQTR